jgi:two-component system sensor histidine kinase KdpD
MMNDDTRPEPESFLATLSREKQREGKGRLKIFFGMCAGVGKTFAMLQAAQALKARGADVVVGIVETHGRAETEALLAGLPVIPRISLIYREVTLLDLNLDEILRRRPEYVLVDELAHTNAVGMRHAKRYQDVLELIDNGINVVSTLNVQHVESLVDTVHQISGVVVRETVPDGILDAADEIELVDISPEDLLRRFSEGKVYAPERSAAAVANFFHKGNLTALREIALRATAQRVDLQLKDFMEENRIPGPWKTVERLMVAVGPSPYSERLIRWTKRIADTMQAPWVAVYIQTAKSPSSEAEKILRKNITLAQELGASVVTTADDDIVRALLRTARHNNVTQIIIGKSQTNPIVDLFQGGSLVNNLIRESGDIDIYVVQGDIGAPKAGRRRRFIPLSMTSTVRQYGAALGTIGVAAIACQAFSSVMDYRSVGMFFLFIIALLSPYIGPGPLFSAATLSAILWDFLFIPPRYTFAISRSADILLVSLYFIIALVTTVLTLRIRRQRDTVRIRERQTESLYFLVRDLSATETPDDIAKIAVSHLSRDFDAQVSLYIAEPGSNNGPDIDRMPHPESSFKDQNEKEWSVAEWVHKNKSPAGRGTGTLPFAKATYYPLMSKEHCYGVVGIVSGKDGQLPFAKEGHFRMSLQQISIALERMFLRAERLSKTFLRSVSHELRTPITAIITASNALSDPGTRAKSESLELLIDDIRTASGRLNRVVENLLNMTRIESGAVTIRREWVDIRDIFNNLLRDLADELEFHTVFVEVRENMPLVEADPVLLQQALSNLLVNAVQYTPPQSRITLAAVYEPAALIITVEDTGPGIPPDSVSRLFEKFYRIPGSRPGGTGLGLSITRAFIEIQGGTIGASNREEGGARFTIRLPVKHADIAQ